MLDSSGQFIHMRDDFSVTAITASRKSQGSNFLPMVLAIACRNRGARQLHYPKDPASISCTNRPLCTPVKLLELSSRLGSNSSPSIQSDVP
jgi:hypothetical protein